MLWPFPRRPTWGSVGLLASFGHDGKTAEFKVVLDDATRNCTPGKNPTLRFAGAQSNLEQFLIGHHAAKPCAR